VDQPLRHPLEDPDPKEEPDNPVLCDKNGGCICNTLERGRRHRVPVRKLRDNSMRAFSCFRRHPAQKHRASMSVVYRRIGKQTRLKIPGER
jgi:hypothetical protein